MNLLGFFSIINQILYVINNIVFNIFDHLGPYCRKSILLSVDNSVILRIFLSPDLEKPGSIPQDCWISFALVTISLDEHISISNRNHSEAFNALFFSLISDSQAKLLDFYFLICRSACHSIYDGSKLFIIIITIFK